MLLPVRCPLCSRPAAGVCAACARTLHPPAPSPHPACFAYAGAGLTLVAALKYHNARAIAPWLAEHLARVAGGSPVDTVTWAPTGVERRRRRGFDQGEVLARAVGRRLGRPVRRLLVRLPDRGHQTGRSRVERLAGPAFVTHRPVGGHILVIDDVVTTGATLDAAVTALIRAGALTARGLALAATEPHTLPGTTKVRR